MAVCELFVVLSSVPVTEGWLAPDVPPVKLLPDGALQVYVVPVGTIVSGGAFTGVNVNDPPLQIEGV